MKIFTSKGKDYSELEELIFEIEKETYEFDALHSFIESNIWQLEEVEDLDFSTRKMLAKEIRENLNKQREIHIKLNDLKYRKLKKEIQKLKIFGHTSDSFLRWIEQEKEKRGINNFWKEYRDNK
jgi:hypothetical protein